MQMMFTKVILQKITYHTPFLNSNWVTFYCVTFPTRLKTLHQSESLVEPGFRILHSPCALNLYCSNMNRKRLKWKVFFLPHQNNLWTLNPQLCCTLNQPFSKRFIYHTSDVIIAYMSKVNRAVLGVGGNCLMRHYKENKDKWKEGKNQR